MPITGLLACGEMIYASQLDKTAVCEGRSWYLMRNPCYLRQFGTRFFTLWDAERREYHKKACETQVTYCMFIVIVKIGVVRRSHGQIQSERCTH
jgi:hypothetical protein